MEYSSEKKYSIKDFVCFGYILTSSHLSLSSLLYSLFTLMVSCHTSTGPHSHALALERELDQVKHRSKREMTEMRGEVDRLTQELDKQRKNQESESLAILPHFTSLVILHSFILMYMCILLYDLALCLHLLGMHHGTLHQVQTSQWLAGMCNFITTAHFT